MAKAKKADEGRFCPHEAEFVLIEVECLLKAAHLSAGAARAANDLDEARGFGAAAEAVMAAVLVEAEKLRQAMYVRPKEA